MSALHSAITSITHNIPSILRDPAVALIGEKCYTILIYDFDVTNVQCLKYALSKGLGLGIVIGGAIVKIPQIVKITSSRSARGLSLTAYILETISYAISLAYASRNKFPFSTYGENLFLTIQNVLITLLILFFSGRGGGMSSGPLSGSHASPKGATGSGNVAKVVAGLVVAIGMGTVLWSEDFCPPRILGLLQAATLPISLASKAPQILANSRNQSTGNLSAFAVFNALLGCLARMFTTKQEVNDPLIFWGFAGATLLNAVLALQMVTYWRSGEGRSWDSTPTRKRVSQEGKVENTQPKIGGDDGIMPGRRWTRKLD